MKTTFLAVALALGVNTQAATIKALIVDGQNNHDYKSTTPHLKKVLEETGLVVRPVAMFEIFERIMRDSEDRPEYHYVLIDYMCLAPEGEARPGSDVSKVAWVRRQDLGRYRITEGTPPVIQKGFDAAARIAV